MTEDGPRRVSGLARSIGSLFPGATPSAPTDDAPGSPGGDSGLAAAVDAVLRALPNPAPHLGRAVRDAATGLAGQGTLDPIVDALRRLAGQGGAVGDPACLALARELASDEVCDAVVTRLAATRGEAERAPLVTVCRRLGGVMAPALGRALAANPERAARRACLDALVSVGEGAAPVVERMVEDARWYVVRNGVTVLGESGGPRAVEMIVSALAHADARVRKEAVRALGKLGGDDAALLVYGKLEDPDAEVRLAAAMAAGSLKIERALKPLLTLLETESDPDIVVGVLNALGQLGDPGAVVAIERRAVASFLSRPPTDVRIAAYRALHAIGTPHSKALLVRAADDKDPDVKSSVRRLLRMR